MHYPSLASFPDVELAAVCDLDTERLTTVADYYGIEHRYTDYRRMIDDIAPDGVYVIGPPHLMYDIWVWCLQHGLNLYIEKPMGLNWHQAQMLTALAEEPGVITQVGHRRSCPLLVAMRTECIRRGPITHAVCEFYKCDQRPFTGAPGDHMLDDCVHSIDTIRWMCGGDVVGVESHCKRVGTPDLNWISEWAPRLPGPDACTRCLLRGGS